jgi:hypothetical protein
VFADFDRSGKRLNLVDVGASNGNYLLPTQLRRQNSGSLAYLRGRCDFRFHADCHALDDETKYRLGLACVAMGFSAFGLNSIRKSTAVSPQGMDAVEAMVNHPPLLRGFGWRGWTFRSSLQSLLDRAKWHR